ncbi:uncharacterized protein LOC129753763 [Uranotaenia lowii]|uniref:uncharacterized protein LOC129753763 n=1 Tax=Uranotaenia lowii TaxID=190385 RepID=UPI0024793BF1|nr:uncharacterized protein LOC129753763 [Uranotaenia lowii]
MNLEPASIPSQLDKHSGVKVLCAVFLALGSTISGLLLPIVRRNTFAGINPRMVSGLAACFDAGMLMATALVLMLPNALSGLPRFAEVIFSGGYFLKYAIQEMLEGSGARMPRNNVSTNVNQIDGDSDGYASGDETFKLSTRNSSRYEQESTQSPEPVFNSRFATKKFLLSNCVVHAIVGGLAIGTQYSGSKIWLLLGAIGVHLFLTAFFLGEQMVTRNSDTENEPYPMTNEPATQKFPHWFNRKRTIPILIYSSGSIVGIVLGMALKRIDDSDNQMLISFVELIIGGFLLAVACNEVLPLERCRRRPGKVDGAFQLMAVGFGFALVSVLSLNT